MKKTSVLLVCALFVALPQSAFSQLKTPVSWNHFFNNARLEQINREADSLGLSRSASAAERVRLLRSGELVPVPRRGCGYYVGTRSGAYLHPVAYTYVRMVACSWAETTGAAWPLTSLHRTEAHQERLVGVYPTAAPARCGLKGAEWLCSDHPWGLSFDVSCERLTEHQCDRLHRFFLQEEAGGHVRVMRKYYFPRHLHVAVRPVDGANLVRMSTGEVDIREGGG